LFFLGITSRLEHFVETGVNAIWMSPIFESPMIDFGYDISNFYDIHYEYGTMADFEELVEKAHRLGEYTLLC
jgi:alpha-glucosidase